MGLTEIILIILIGFCQSCYSFPNVTPSLHNETPWALSTVNRNGSLSSRNIQSHFQYKHTGGTQDNGGYELNNWNRNDYARNSKSYDKHHHNNKLHADWSSPREMKKNHSVCTSFFHLSIFGTFLIMVGLFNTLVNSIIMYDTISSSGASSITNSVTNANNNNNQDTNNNNNDNFNYNYNYNENDLPRSGRQNEIDENEPNFQDFEDFNIATDGEERASREPRLLWKKKCSCHESRRKDSWLSTGRKRLEAVWSGVRDFLSVNPECGSRMACEIASPFVPSSVTPYLAVLPSRMEEARSLLMTSASGNCTFAYDRCPLSLDPVIRQITRWL